MTKVSSCINPVDIEALKGKGYEDSLYYVADYPRLEYMNQCKLYHLDFELLSRCAGSCAYCYASSNTFTDITMPTDKVLEVIDQAVALGVKHISWCGGDPILHPEWFRIMNYATENGLKHKAITSGMIPKDTAKKLCELEPNMQHVGIHIDTINQDDYNKVHTNPQTLEAKVQGYRNLLDAGFPPGKVVGCLTVTKPIMNSIEETIDWFIDEMGANYVAYVQFKAEGLGGQHKEWEPNLSDIKRLLEYRAKKLGNKWLRIGASDGGRFYCRTMVGITYDGGVVPCLCIRDQVTGNLYAESLAEIFEKDRDELLFNYEIKDFCGKDCENRDVCFGCRATAYHYLGDVRASDPKCPYNPQAKEYCYQ